MLFFGKKIFGKNINSKEKEKPNEDYLSFLDIKVIPDRFNLNKINSEVSSNKKSKKWIIIIVVLIILLVISILAVIGKYSDLSEKTNAPIVSNELEQNVNEQPEEDKSEFALDINSSEEKVNSDQKESLNNVNIEDKNTNSSAVNEKEFAEKENNNSLAFNIIPIGQDSDRDGLTDVEEKIFGSQSKKPDTDGDSYLDGSEVINLYSPLKANVKLMEEKELIKIYYNDKYKYQFIYPQVWSLTENLTKDQVLISVPSQSERFSLYVKDNFSSLTAESYYIDNYQSSLGSYESFNINGFSGIKSVNNQLIVFSYQNNLLIFEYSVGESKTLEFYSIFMMILKSFSAK